MIKKKVKQISCDLDMTSQYLGPAAELSARCLCTLASVPAGPRSQGAQHHDSYDDYNFLVKSRTEQRYKEI